MLQQICGLPGCPSFPPSGQPWVYTDDFDVSTCGRHTHAEFVAHYAREGRRAAVEAYERLVIEASIALYEADWTSTYVKAAVDHTRLTAALVAEREALAGMENRSTAIAADPLEGPAMGLC